MQRCGEGSAGKHAHAKTGCAGLTAGAITCHGRPSPNHFSKNLPAGRSQGAATSLPTPAHLAEAPVQAKALQPLHDGGLKWHIRHGQVLLQQRERGGQGKTVIDPSCLWPSDGGASGPLLPCPSSPMRAALHPPPAARRQLGGRRQLRSARQPQSCMPRSLPVAFRRAGLLRPQACIIRRACGTPAPPTCSQGCSSSCSAVGRAFSSRFRHACTKSRASPADAGTPGNIERRRVSRAAVGLPCAGSPPHRPCPVPVGVAHGCTQPHMGITRITSGGSTQGLTECAARTAAGQAFPTGQGRLEHRGHPDTGGHLPT